MFNIIIVIIILKKKTCLSTVIILFPANTTREQLPAQAPGSGLPRNNMSVSPKTRLVAE